MTVEELQLLEMLLSNFLTYDVTWDVMIDEDVRRALEIVQRELKETK